MNTILISTSKFGTAIPNYFQYLGREFKENNFSVIFIFDGQIKNLPSNQDNIKYHSYPSKRPTHIADFIFLYKIIKKEKPILCISNFGSTNVVSIISFILRVPTRINYLHTSPNQLNIDSNKTYIAQKILQIRKIFILKMNTHFLTNSTQMSKLISKFFKIKKNKISILPYLIEEKKTKCSSYNARSFNICIIGRLTPSKGHYDLLNAFKKTLEIYPELKLYIIGDGEEKNRLTKLSKNLDIFENIIFLNHVPNEKIHNIYSNALCSVSASKSEAFGIVNIESLREGTPIICTKTEGSRDIIKNGKNGFFIDFNKKNELTEKINIILNNWDNFSENAQKDFKDNYSSKNINNHFQKLKNFINSTNDKH